MVIDIKNMSPLIIALITIFFSSPILVTVVNFFMYRRKNTADVDHIIMQNMEILVNSYKDNKLLDEQIKSELRTEIAEHKINLRTIRERQEMYLKNSTDALSLLANTQKELVVIKENYQKCMKEHEFARKEIVLHYFREFCSLSTLSNAVFNSLPSICNLTVCNVSFFSTV